MRSIKPGRGPSMMGAFGSAIAVIFGIVWTISALSMGAPILFGLFGVLFVIMGVAQVVYNYKNATSKKRFSVFDITENNEEPDPLSEYLGFENKTNNERIAEQRQEKNNYCPYCGEKLNSDYLYCNNCGKKLP